jgi:hypothetical protein
LLKYLCFSYLPSFGSSENDRRFQSNIAWCSSSSLLISQPCSSSENLRSQSQYHSKFVSDHNLPGEIPNRGIIVRENNKMERETCIPELACAIEVQNRLRSRIEGREIRSELWRVDRICRGKFAWFKDITGHSLQLCQQPTFCLDHVRSFYIQKPKIHRCSRCMSWLLSWDMLSRGGLSFSWWNL